MSKTFVSRTRGGTAWIALAALAAAGCIGRAPEAARTATVGRGDVDVSVGATGTLKARNSTKIHSELQREGKIIFLVAEGTLVKKDEVLVRLDPTELQRELENVERELATARANLDTAVVEYRIQESDGKNQIKKADLALKQAEQDLKRYKEGDAPIQENKLRIALEEGRSSEDRARTKYEQMPMLRQKGFVTASQEEEERIRWEKAKVELDSARRELELFQTYTFPMERARREEAVEQSQSELEAVKLRSDSQLKQRESGKFQAESLVKNIERKKRDIDEGLSKLTISAPTDGLIVYGDAGERRWRSDDEIKVGGRVWPHMTIITLPDLSEMELVFRVHESDIGKIRQGMAGKVVVESVADRVFPGEVTMVANLANAGDWRQDETVRTFEAEFRLAGKDLGLKPGISARVEIPVGRKENALRVPVSGVHGEPGRFFCFVSGPRGWERRDLVLGLSNDAFAEVLSGLSEGDSILLGAPPGDAGNAAAGAPSADPQKAPKAEVAPSTPAK
jgi:HlyD family secretion protein